MTPKKLNEKDCGPSQRKGEVEIRTDKGNHQGKKTKALLVITVWKRHLTQRQNNF